MLPKLGFPFRSVRRRERYLRTAKIALSLLAVGVTGNFPLEGKVVANKSKHIIGATATITEAKSGFAFAARIDTGAKTCSIHVEDWKIDDPAERPLRNVGKPIRLLLKDDKGKTKWIESTIVGRVRVRSGVHRDGDYQGRYKVQLPLEWQGVTKVVAVTINDRADMEFPLLIGRNFLRDDYLVDVSLDNPGDKKDDDEDDE